MNKNVVHLSFILAALMVSASALTKFPQAGISNGLVHARIYLPDATKGYYRATRFDWSGVMPNLEWNGHRYCAEWFNDYSPVKNDAIMGPVESFSPLGYAGAKPGERFVQVGVGALTKFQDIPYSAFSYYPISNYGQWQIKTNASGIECTHVLQDSPYAYSYKKKITLVKGKPILQLIHTLTNTGQQVIETDVYNHNLFVLDGQLPGPGYSVQFPFSLQAVAAGQRGIGPEGIAKIKDSLLLFNKEMGKNESAYTMLTGYGDTVKDYDIRIENHITGAGIRITSDRPLSKLVFWASSRIFSPEPYINIHIAPGDTFSWTIAYEFYNCVVIK